GQYDEGRAYVYHGSAAGLSETADWFAESDQASAWFGNSVSVAGDVNGDGYSDVIVGAYRYDNGQTDEGRAFVYHGSSTGLSATPDWTAESDQAEARFGWSVSAAGDVNGDGYSDVIVGAYWYDNGQTDEGRAYVYHGSATGLAATPCWTAESDQANAWFGYSVSAAGDVNGDGYSDVIVAAVWYDSGQTNEGRVYAFHGSAAGLCSNAGWSAESDQASAQFGNSVSSAGDVNGDGYSDVIVGVYWYDNGEINEGRAYVYHGSATGLSLTPDWTAESDQAFARFGHSVSGAGDVNGDGYSDVIVSALNYDNGQVDEGRAYVYHGSATGLYLMPDWTAESNQTEAEFGISVSSAGDVNGDGYSDVIVGAYRYDNGQTNEGRAYVFHGSAAGLPLTSDWTAESDQAEARFGGSVSTVGDVNGDGYSDVIVGAYWYDNGQTNEGRAYVYHGSATGLSLNPDWTAESDQAGAGFGHSVSAAGDVNGDGYSDVIVGAPNYSNGQINEGRSFLYFGNEGVGVPVKPEQLRVDYSVPIVPALFTYSNTSFGARFLGRSDYGRVLVKAQFEAKALGIPFSESGLIETDWIDIDTAGVEISQVIDGLVLNTLYKWRARIKYHPKYGAPIHSRWYYIQSNGLTECDLRIGGETGVNEYPFTISYLRLRLSVMYVSGGVSFVCTVPAGMGDGDFVVYNLLGAEVDRVDLSLGEAGEYRLEWSCQDRKGNTLPSGVYFARVITGDAISNTVKFVFVR
ncbi:MAG: FG-GAP repeat protein, partial [candidate division WOR-3 bacterium]